ncbi:histone-lysine N-methyltransferase SETD8-A [Elysia marginata]|uniref:Histone-lysine N-methyltransferase SETD8-A n=1 Tax=Elysia marginata TaxID=1093978 RepID=A0AAV4G4U7_9GAST|nr:histone-lysine N-methyltransferase SETD8-A [Elysia marginata]
MRSSKEGFLKAKSSGGQFESLVTTLKVSLLSVNITVIPARLGVAFGCLKQLQRPKRPCPYCGEFQAQFVRHLKRHHRNEDAVSAALDLPVVEQRRAFAQIRKKGIFEKNLALLQQGEPLLRERRYGNSQDVKMCGGCHGFFSSKQIYRHKQVCDMSQGIRGGAVDLKKAVSIASLDISDELRDMVKCFRDDPAGDLCRTDTLILLLGEYLLAKSIKKEKHVIMAEMRLLANLIIEMSLLKGQKLNGENVMELDNFNILSKAVTAMTHRESGEQKSGLKLRLGYLLKKLINISKGHYIQLRMETKAAEVESFRALMKLKWDMLFYSAQVQVLARRNALRRPQAMPLEKDVMALRNFLLKEMASMCSDVRLSWDSHDFVRLRNFTVCRLTMFNARRGGEPARLTMKEWEDAAAGAWVDPQRVLSITDPLEQALVSEYKLAYQAGKGSKKLVPVLIPLDSWDAMNRLIKIRKSACISPENVFVFANTSGSKDHVIGWQAMKYVTMMMGQELDRPDLLIADKFRHRMSTLFALLDVPQSQRETFYKHMGHSQAINEAVYQSPLALNEVVHVGGFLQTVDQGLVMAAPRSQQCNRFEGHQRDPTEVQHLDLPGVQQHDLPEVPQHDLPEVQQRDLSGDQQRNLPGDQQRAVFPEKNVAAPKVRRYFRWDATATQLVKDYFHQYLTAGFDSKGSLPGKSQVIEFLREFPILEKFTESEKIDLVKTKVFNERKKLRSNLEALKM